MNFFTKLLALIILCNQLTAQNSAPSEQWKKTIRGQYSSPFEEVVTSVKDNIGNVYVLCQDYINIYVVKYNASGAIVNVMLYNGPENGTEYAYDLKLASDGSIIVGASLPGPSSMLPGIVKFDANGNLLWAKTLNGGIALSNKIKSISIDMFDNIHFCGSVSDSVFAGKLNPQGTVLWRKTYAPSSSFSTGAANMVVSDDNGITYLAGKVINTSANSDFFVSKISATGVVQWNKTLNGFANANDEALFIKLDNNYNCYIAGMMADTSAINKTATVIKYNAAGGQQWVKKLHQTGLYKQVDINIEDFYLDNQGNSYVAMKEHRYLYNFFNTKIVKLSSLGTVNWTNMYTGNGLDQIPYSISTDNFGNVYACGTEQLPVGADVFILKYDPSGNNLFNMTYDYSTTAYEIPKSLTIDNSGSIYLATTFNFISPSKSDVGLLKFNSIGSLQFVSLYNAPISSISQSRKLILNNNHTYALGTIINNGSTHDIAVSNFDDQGFVQWQNVVDYEAEHNTANDMAKAGSDLYVIGTQNTSSGSIIIKYDSIGSLMWMDTVAHCQYTKVAVQSNGRPVFTGETSTGANEKDFRIAIYDPSTGNAIFENTPAPFPNYRSDVSSMAIDQNDNTYALGFCRYISTANHVKMKLQKFNVNGLLQWTKEISGTDSTDFAYTNPYKVITDNNSNIYVIASAKMLSTGLVESIIIKYDPNGTVIWQQRYTLSSISETLNSAMMSDNGFIYMYSRQQSAAPIVLRKINPLNGAVTWVQTPSVYPYALSYNGIIALDSMNNIFLTSSAILNNDNLIYLAKFDSLGTHLWRTHFNGNYTGSDDPNDLKVSNNGRIYLLASAVMSNYGNIPDITLVKLCDIPEPIITSSSPDIDLCPGSSVNLQASGGTSYLWNHDNVTTPSILADTTGAYYATVFLNDGCFKNTDTISVNLLTPQTPNICMVSVDSASSHNQIYWDKSLYTNVDSFIVHREVSTNIYKRIGAVSKNSFSMFTDTNRTIGPANGDPNISSYRYKLQIKDTCGNLGSLSPYHNSIYFITNNTGTYFWNTYNIESQTTPVNTFTLLRDDNNTGVWNVIGSTAGTQTTLNDPMYASYPSGVWRVEADGFNCSSTSKMAAQVVKSKSNVKNNFSVITGLDALNSNVLFSVAPNPATTDITISFNSEIKESTTITITNVLGKVVYVREVSEGTTTTMSLNDLVTGIYFIRIQQGANFTDKKFIKN